MAIFWKALIFDRDGTLFDSLPLILRAFNYGIEPFTSHRPTDKEWIDAFGPDEPVVLSRFVPPGKADDAFHRFYAFYQEHISESPLFSGMRELLVRAKEAGVHLGLFTGGGKDSTILCLGKYEILPLFDVLITGDIVTHPKPHPEGILKAVARLGVLPEDTLVVGDSGADVEAATRAGAAGALATWSSYPVAYTSEVPPDYVFDGVADLERFVFGERS